METAVIDTTRSGGTEAGARRSDHAGAALPPGESGRTSTFVAAMNRLGSWRIWVVSAAVFVAFASVLFASQASFSIPAVEAACGQSPPDVRPFPAGDEVSAFLESCGPGGRDAYRNMQVADLIYPLVSGLFMASSLALVLHRLFPRRPSMVVLAGLALIGTAFDYLENVFAWLALAAYPQRAATNGLLGFASLAKNLAFWLAGAILLVGLLSQVVRGLRRMAGERGRAALTIGDTTSQ